MQRSRRVSCILGFPRSRWVVASSIVVTGAREVIGGMMESGAKEMIVGMVGRGDMVGARVVDIGVVEGVEGK